ncbi:MAG: PD-(D/E)XK nuclease family protein [Candidatus Zixiibacteriota bacterium]|jgi:CRISPR/Cas system-associated exonuclease Cas4 (RecB family)
MTCINDASAHPVDAYGAPVPPGDEVVRPEGADPAQRLEPPDPAPGPGWRRPNDGDGGVTSYLKLSPSKIHTALSCPRKYKYRYVDGLTLKRMPSTLAFGRAIHAAIQAAYARQKAPMTVDEVAGSFALYFNHLDKQGIIYKEKESLEDLVEKGKALAAEWWRLFRDDVLAVDILSVESELTVDIGFGLAFRGYPDVIEERDGLLYIGDHKTVASWGESDEILAARSIQLTAYAYLCEKKYGRLPDKLYFTVLKKTKKPQVFRYFTERTRADVDAFEDYVRDVARLINYCGDNGVYPDNITRDCTWCEFTGLCWGTENARAAFITREERRRQEKEAEGKRKAALGNAIMASVDPKYDGDEQARKLAVIGHYVESLDDEQ